MLRADALAPPSGFGSIIRYNSSTKLSASEAQTRLTLPQISRSSFLAALFGGVGKGNRPAAARVVSFQVSSS